MIVEEESNFEENVPSNEDCKDNDADGRKTAAGPPPTPATDRQYHDDLSAETVNSEEDGLAKTPTTILQNNISSQYIMIHKKKRQHFFEMPSGI